jgi:uncharacterized protein
MKHVPFSHRFEIDNVAVAAKTIAKEHDGLRVAQLSDIHVGIATPRARLRGVVQHLNDAKPDLVVMTGDYVTWARYALRWLPTYLEGIAAPVVCVLGNHDHVVGSADTRRVLEDLGYIVLQNDVRVLPLRNHPFAVAGIDDGYTRRDDVAATFARLPSKMSALVLTHTPKTVRKLPPNADYICLTGHLHGGQIRVGTMTERLAQTVLDEPHIAGLHRVGGNNLYVNRGLGYGRGVLMPRFRAKPELTMLTLAHAA